jgi:hypothetical protein
MKLLKVGSKKTKNIMMFNDPQRKRSGVLDRQKNKQGECPFANYINHNTKVRRINRVMLKIQKAKGQVNH